MLDGRLTLMLIDLAEWLNGENINLWMEKTSMKVQL